MRKHVIWVVIILVILAACGNQGEVKNITLEPVHIWHPENITNSNIMLCSGVYKDTVYYAQRIGQDFGVRFASFDGQTQNKFKIPGGRGPGQAMQTLGVKIKNDKVYFADLALQRITKFSKDGEYLDSFEYKTDMGTIGTFDVGEDYLYFHSLNKVFLGKMSLKDGSLIKKIDHKYEEIPQNNDTFDGGAVKIDPYNNKITFAHWSVPYRIRTYDKDLKKSSLVKNKKLAKECDKMYWRIGRGTFSVVGSMIAASLSFDYNNIYSPLISGKMKYTGDGMEVDNIVPYILAFDKEKKKLKAKMKIKNLDTIKGFINVLGVTDKYIIVHIEDTSDNFKKAYKKDYNAAILVCKKPVNL